MADYTNSKLNARGVFPENAVDGKEWNRTEPVITAEQVVDRFLFGIPLVSATINPITKKADVMTIEKIKDRIHLAIANCELEMGIDIFPVKRSERHPFDRNFMQQFGYFRTQHKPILSVDKISIRPADDVDVFIVPPEWISVAYPAKGQINLWPIGPSTLVENSNQFGGGANGALVLLAVDRLGWQPNWWTIEYTSGFREENLPVVVNEIIGCTVAIDVCNLIAATYRFSSHSLGIDAISQSQSGPGPQVYAVKIKDLQDKKDKLIQKMKATYNSKFSLGTL